MLSCHPCLFVLDLLLQLRVLAPATASLASQGIFLLFDELLGLSKALSLFLVLRMFMDEVAGSDNFEASKNDHFVG